MLLPSAADIIDVCLDQSLSDPKLSLVHADILRHFDEWLKPELGFAIGAMHMNVHARLLAREKVEAITGLSEYRGTHVARDYGMQYAGYPLTAGFASLLPPYLLAALQAIAGDF